MSEAQRSNVHVADATEPLSDMPPTMPPHHLTTNDKEINGGHINEVLHSNTNGVQAQEASVNGTNTTNWPAPPPPIAVVGMALRLPGGIKSPDNLWDLLMNKGNARSRIPKDRYNIDAFHGPEAKPGEVSPQHGYFLEDSLEHFDAGFFAMSKAEVAELDPQQKLLLEVVWECMESGGQTNWRGTKVGCYVGVFGEDWLDLCSKDTQNHGMYRTMGTGDFAIANRVSYEYDLKGPSMTIRTGCSSALIGLHEACESLYSGHCSSAIVAGTNLIITPTMTQAMTMQRVLSPTGSCKTFDAKADGYARGEAINAIFIKKLDDALRDGDPIRAVIRATASNCDGKTAGISNPSSEAHEEMMRSAYSRACLSAPRTAYVECHGTGTPVGDPLETTAVGNVFRGAGVYIGSVKPNVGHSEGASGITSLIKAVLALENRIIPPNINFSTPNPKIPFEAAKLRVPLEPTQWPADRDERASVNSFGIGGTNVHVIIDSAASFLQRRREKPSGVSTEQCIPLLLPISANTTESLRRLTTGLHNYLDQHPGAQDDIAYTLASRRDRLPHRTFGLVEKTGLVHFSNFIRTPRSVPKVNFVFTGQGAQWAGMGVELMEAFPRFRHDIQYLDSVLQPLKLDSSWSLEDALLAPPSTSRINDSEFSQPLCTALQIALVNLLKSWGISPSAVVGHSSGEIAAAYASGAISAEGAIIVAFYRGQVTKTQTSPGGMAAIGLGREAVVPYLRSGVVIACENSPSSVTLSGDLGPLDAVLEAIREAQPDTFCRKLRVAMAYHSHHMSEIGESYELLMYHHIQSHAPQVPFYSSVYGKRLSESGSLGSQYWRANLERPVLFYTATRAILNDESEPSLFLEIGPHSALAGPLRQIFQEKKSTTDPIYVATLARNESQVSCMLKTAGQLFQHGVRVDFDAINGTGHVLTNLPTYPWQHDISYWKETRISRNWRLRPYPHHELLGSRILESSDIEPSWRNVLDLENVPWLRDHKIVEDIVFPAAGYIAAVGEAIRQTTGSKSYCIRRLVVKNALVIQESQDLELITNFKPYRLTDSLESEWYEFTIASYNGSAWIQHCTGQARASAACEVKTGSVNQYPRVVQSATWYSVMKKMGLNYGPRFQQLNGIKVHPTRNIASANVWDDPQLHKSAYAVHPTTIDQTLQLFTVAMSNGLSRRLNKLAIPSTFGEIYIGEAGPEIDIEVEAHVTPKGAVKGSATATNNGKTVISLNQGLFSPLETDDSNPEDADSLQAVRLEWQPDINFMQDKDLMRPVSKRESVLLVEKVALLCMIETYHQIKSQEIAVSHLSKFRDWLHKECERMAAGEYDDTVPEAREWTSLTSEQRLQALQEAQHAAFVHKDSASVAPVAQRVLDSCLELVQGKVAGVELLIEDEGLASIYNFYQDMMDFAPFFRLQSHAKPTLRVLEIGAGTGGTTSKVLEALHSAEGVRMYSKYHYTDISSGFFPNAKERFKNYAGIDYSILDISKDPLEQGFEMGTYDVIIASNVLHATPSLHQTLTNVRKLTAPGGRLFLQELSPRMRWTNYIMGILPGWWLGEADDRPQEPFITPSRWETELRAVGFSGVDTLVYDDEEPYQTNAHMITTAIGTEKSPNKTVALLYRSEISTLAQDVGKKFEEQGFGVKWYTLDQEPERNETVISLLDLDRPFLYEISSDDFKVLQSFLSSCNSRSCNIIWVTKPAQVQCQDPRYGLLPGFARTIRSEMSLNFATFEAENFGPDVWVALAQVAEKFGDVGKDEEFNPEFEYAYFDGKVHTSRFHWISSADDQEVMTESAPDALVRLSVEKYGSLDSLEWKPGNSKELVGDEVEIEIKSVGLNFRDVLVTMGIVDGVKDMLGLEGSGVVRRIAPGVKDLHIGDRVFICDSGCFATRMVTSEKLCARIPDSLGFEEAATMPCVYNTVIHSLVNIGGLESGQSVLIHSACGGVGIAAIQVCRMLGAEIFATVGNEEKVHYLMDTFGIPRSRIFDSRSASFLPDLMRETDGRGADLVLNSLSGELLHASWQCVAEFGKMLEIGKRDFIGRAMLSMDVFQANRSFVGIDLAELGVKKPKECQKLLKQCLEYYAQGSIESIRPMKAFEGARIGDAFRYMQKGQHIGKIVINMPESAEALVVQAQVQEAKFRPDSSYLLIGGLGGLGRALSTWMVERGARSLVYLSRSAGDSSDDRAFFDELKAQKCEVTAVKGSVAVLEDVARGIELAPKPIAGVVQMSMVLRDANFLNMTHEDWNTTLASKVRGTWNLHKALQDMTLDFFLLFSSISGIVGQWGQSNYAAANTFLDSFVQYRQSLGLPASVIDVGVMGDVGYVSQNAAMLEALRTSSAHTLGESNLLSAVSMAIKRSTPRPMTDTPFCNRSQLAIGMASTKLMTDPSNRSVWKRDLRMALYRNRTASKDSGPSNASEGLKEFLSAISSDPEGLDQKENADFLTREIGLRIKSLILSSDDELDPKRTLADMGVDSLVSIEIRNWWRRTLGLEISVLEIMNAGSVERLGSIAVEGLKAKFGDKRAPHPGLAMKAP